MLRRHDLLRVGIADWTAILARRGHLASEPLVRDWARRGWPLIVRRFSGPERANIIPAAIPLPPSLGKRRIAIDLPTETEVLRLSRVDLRSVSKTAPQSWHKTIAALCDAADAAGCEVRPFGALLWQHVTGLPYLSAASDLDFTWEVSAPEVAPRLLDRLADLDREAPMRLDGELVFPDGAAVNWRELCVARQQGHAEVIAKTIAGVEVRPVAQLLADLAECS